MTRTLAISDTGLRLIKAFEGFRPDDRTLVTGIRVVGYGHRLEQDDAPVQMSRADAEEQLLEDLEPIEDVVNDEVHAPLSQGQFDALCSLAFNIGIEAFRASDIVRAMNNGRVLDAANGFDVWRKATVNGKTYVIDALMRRRTAEKSLFLRNEPAVPAPSAMLQPEADPTVTERAPAGASSFVPIGEASGVIKAANIVNAERADAAIGVVTFADTAAHDDLEDEEDAFETLDLSDADYLDDDKDEDDGFDCEDDDFEDDLDDDDADYDDESDEDELTGFNRDDDGFDGDDFDDDGFEEEPNERDDDRAADRGEEAQDDDKMTNAPSDDTALLTDSLIVAETPLVHDSRAADDEADIFHLPDLSALIAPRDRVEMVKDEADAISDLDIGPEDDEAELPSVISDAATSLGDRLSALLDTDESETDMQPDAIEALPASLLQTGEASDTVSAHSDAALTETMAAEDMSHNMDDAARSNLVSFPKRELVLDDPIATEDDLSEDKVPENDMSHSGLKVIDDLAADDVIRASREPENPIFDPEGDPVENAMRYLERQASEHEAKKSSGGMWIPIALGALLVGASAVLLGRGATQMLSSWGPTAVTAAAITGGLTIIFGIYAAARGRMA